MTCNLYRYLAEQESSCRDMAITANADSPMSTEWRNVAIALLALRTQHAERCPKCSSTRKGETDVRQLRI